MANDNMKKILLPLDVIDPSFFDENHNILQLFVAQLYITFIQSEKYKSNKHQNETINLQRDFLQLQNNLKYLDHKITAESFDYDDSLQLESLAAGVSLQSSLRKVVRETLKFLNKDCMLIAIDDLDINVNRAYEMMEQIRKYLIMPELIIILSAKPDQLENAIKLHLKRVYSKIGMDNDDEISEMAEKYLSKFLPQSHRVYMANPEILLSAMLDVRKENGELLREKPFEDVAGGILDLIFHKTRYLFYNKDNSYSHILPRNLRNLAMLIELLVGMPDHDDNVYITYEDSSQAHQNLVNKQRFKDYLINDALTVLNLTNREIVLDLYNTSEVPKLNKLVLSRLRDKYYQYIPNYYDNVSWNNIMSQDAKDFNVSLGDVVETLNHLSQVIIEDEDRYLLFAIQTMYSIRLYELYDEMTDSFNSSLKVRPTESRELQNPDNNADKNNNSSGNKVCLLNYIQSYQEIPDFLKLIGGTFFSFDRQQRLLQGARDLRLLDGRLINQEIYKLIKAAEVNDKDGKYSLPDEVIPKLRLLEFMVLCAAFHIDTRKTKDIPQMLKEFRSSPIPYFVKPLNTGLKNIVFSITKPLFSLIYPRLAYSVFGENFWKLCNDLADAETPSLLGLILKERRYKYDPNVSEMSGLASKASIRNMEILIDLYNKLLESGSNIRVNMKEGGVPGMYATFLNRISNYKWQTYTFTETKDEYHTIELGILQPLVEVLRTVTDRKDLRSLFEKCFTDADEDDKNRPQKGTPEYLRFSPGYYYDVPLIRQIIFSHYPEYKEDYEKNKEGYLHKKLSSNKEFRGNDGEEITRYLAAISDKKYIFIESIGEELQDDYLRRLEEKGFDAQTIKSSLLKISGS